MLWQNNAFLCCLSRSCFGNSPSHSTGAFIPSVSSLLVIFFQRIFIKNELDFNFFHLPRPRAYRPPQPTMGQIRKIHRINSYLINHCPTSEGVSEMSERMSEQAQRSVRAKRVVRSEQMSERCVRTSERRSKWPTTYVSIHGSSEPQCSIFSVLNAHP